MPISLASLMLGATLLVAETGEFPKLDVAPSCHAAATMGESMDATFKQCMDDEQDALAQLRQRWSQFQLSDRASCLAAEADVPGLSSYVELLECLNMARDAQGDDAMTGGGSKP